MFVHQTPPNVADLLRMSSMTEPLFLLSSIFLSILFTFSAATKLANRKDNQSRKASAFDRAALHPSVAFFELYLALLLSQTDAVAPKWIAALAALLIFAAGAVYSISTKRSCPCFGASADTPLRKSLLIQFAGMVAVIPILLTQTSTTDPSRYAIFAAFAVAFGAAAVIYSGYQPIEPTAQRTNRPIISIPSNQLIGYGQDATPVFVKDVLISGKPTFICAVHSKCPACKSLLPDVLNLAVGFAHQFPIIVLSEEANYFTCLDIPTSLITLSDPDQALGRFLKPDALPYALLLNGTDGRTMAPPALGDGGVRMLFAILLNARKNK